MRFAWRRGANFCQNQVARPSAARNSPGDWTGSARSSRPGRSPVVIDAAVFRRVSLFAELEPAELQTLSQVATARHVPAGAAILREAEAGDQFFVVVKGEVKVFVDSPDGREVVLTHLQTGEFFGEMALFEGEPRSASVTALTETELVVLSRN